MIDSPIAFVTGAARGIGRQIAHDLLDRGYRVVLGDLDLAATESTALELGDGASAVQLDVTDGQQLADIIASVEKRLGPIDLWVNNAGIMPTGPFHDQPVDLAATIIDVNYTGVVRATSAILPGMFDRGSGTIINVASATGIKPLAGLAVYSGTKAAIIAFSDALRRELRGTGVNVRVVLPNLVRTPLGAGITPPRLTGSVNAQTVSASVMRLLHGRRYSTVVPRGLGPVLRFSRLLPVAVQDWIDDRVGTDRIGLGGDPAVRAAYLRDVLRKQH